MKTIYTVCLLIITSSISPAPSTRSNPSSQFVAIIITASTTTIVAGYTLLRHLIRGKRNRDFVDALKQRKKKKAKRLFLEGANPNQTIKVDTALSFGCTPESKKLFTMELPLLDHFLSNVHLQSDARKQRKKKKTKRLFLEDDTSEYHNAEQTVLLLLDTNSWNRANGCTVDYRNLFGRTPLHYAPTNAIALKLIEQGAPINAQDQFGRTPLHEAARKNRIGLVDALIKRQAELFIHDNEEYPPLALIPDRSDGTTAQCEDIINAAIENQQNDYKKYITILHRENHPGLSPEDLLTQDRELVGPIDIIINFLVDSFTPAEPYRTIDPADTHIKNWMAEQERRAALQKMLAGVVIAGVATAGIATSIKK